MIQFDTIVIKQIPDEFAALTGLDKHNRSKMPGTIEMLQPGIGPDGRFVTGFDEDCMAVQQIRDDKKREEKREEVRKFRESLQRATGISDLSGTSSYWETYKVIIRADEDLILNGANASDIVKYCILVANRFAAPDQDSAAAPEYLQTKYYCYRKERIDEETVSAQKAKDKARAKLLEISDDKERLVLIGNYLEGNKYKVTMSPSTLYRMLSDYIEDPKETENRRRFLKATEAKVEDLQFKVTVDLAIKKKVIRHEKGYYTLGGKILGKNAADVLSNLKLPEFADAFLQIRDEIEA